MAASARKKQDEKHLKILRELAVQNKYCFDCNQRGPTYVNVTIGSFVCTKCSGMLRGITPPHRVKSISMATFTPEEIDLLKMRGNEYCRRVWLGLHEGAQLVNASDEHAVRDLMVDKYEKRRFYLEPAQTMQNGKPERPKPPSAQQQQQQSIIIDKPVARVNGTNKEHHRTRPEVHNNFKNNMDFVADFDRADIFSANNINNSQNDLQLQQQQQQQMTNGFANFDNNPVFATNVVSNGRNGNHSALLTPNFNGTQNNNNGWTTKANVVEDKYAALKDLDNALKTQSAVDWGSTGSSNGSLYSSPTPTTGSMYSSSSPQSSLFGSPSQSNFMSAFAPQQQQQQQQPEPQVSNPFNNGWPMLGNNGNPNPFKDVNGFNPFKMGQAPIISNNPFL